MNNEQGLSQLATAACGSDKEIEPDMTTRLAGDGTREACRESWPKSWMQWPRGRQRGACNEGQYRKL